MNYKDMLRKSKMPHIWCPGCGHGIVLSAFLRAMVEKNIDPDKVVVVSGIGCSSRASGYLDFNTLHTTHGRAIPFATGIKLANPELKVIVLTGDGDSSAIGGNHLIHGARRNLDLTVIVFNNSIYGMTSGQYSPLTPHMDKATTAPYGNFDYPFDLVELVRALALPLWPGAPPHIPGNWKKSSAKPWTIADLALLRPSASVPPIMAGKISWVHP